MMKSSNYRSGIYKGEPIMTETSPGHWNDKFNNVFIDETLPGRNKFTGEPIRGAVKVPERLPGNKLVIWAKFTHDEAQKAMDLAERLVVGPN